MYTLPAKTNMETKHPHIVEAALFPFPKPIILRGKWALGTRTVN